MIKTIQLNSDKLKLIIALKREGVSEFCEKANIHYTPYLRIAKGQSIKPSTAGKIANALGIKIQDLLKDIKG